MKILVLDNPALVDELREHHQVVTSGRWEDRYDIVRQELHPPLTEVLRECRDRFFDPDALVFIEGGVKHLWTEMESVEKPMAYYAIDSHLHFGWQRSYGRLFDVVFVAQKDYIERFRAWGVREAQWLPHACAADHDRLLGLDRDLDVAFVGKLDPRIHPERAAFFEKLKERLAGKAGLFVTSGEYVEVYNRARIVLNESVSGDLNMRVFEAMACGSLLVTDEVSNGLTELFEPGRDLVLYRHGDVDDAAEKILHFLARETERRGIAESGHGKAMDHHTTRHRAAKVAEALAGLTGHPRAWSAKSDLDLGKSYLMLAYPNSPVFAERIQRAAEYLGRAAVRGAPEVEPYLALVAVLRRNPSVAVQHLMKALGHPEERFLACWMLALLLSGQDGPRSEAYYQMAFRELLDRPGVSAEARECVDVTAAFLSDRLRSVAP